ncbi:MAG TPA: outer membrane beta-barrel protein [Gammaproteobacteria bacterium]
MKNRALALLALLTLGAAPAVHAQDGSAYYGVSLGEFNYSETGDIDDTASSWKLSINYQFLDHLAVEGAYGQTGDFHSTITVPTFPVGTVDLDFKAEYSRIFAIRMLGILPFKSGVSLMGGLGYSQMKFKVDLSDGQSSVSIDQDENNLGYYAGVQYDWDRFAMRLGYEMFDLDSGRDANETMLSFFYKL